MRKWLKPLFTQGLHYYPRMNSWAMGNVMQDQSVKTDWKPDIIPYSLINMNIIITVTYEKMRQFLYSIII